MFAILSVLSILLTLASPPTWESPVALVWPFADGAIRSVAIGYGDWCTKSEGPHPGIDFGADNDDIIRNPLNTDGYIIGQWPSLKCPYPETEGSLVIAPNLPGASNWGWQYDHILLPADNWFLYAPGTPIPSGIDLDLQTNPDHMIFQHLHVFWMWVWKTVEFSGSGEWVPGHAYPGGQIPAGGYVNPFEYLPAADLIDYDDVRFGKVWIDNSVRGIWFSPDGAEVEDDFSLIVTPAEFQNEIFGVVDFAAAPYSAFGDNPDMDKCGVYSVGHQLAWINPYTENIDQVYYNNVFSSRYDSVLNEGGADYYRTLVEMSGALPYDSDEEVLANTDEYRAAFLDGELVGDRRGGSRIDERWFNSAYILSNCGNLDVGPDGWENIPLFNNAICHHFWSSNVMCVGGWDTQLRRGDRGGSASSEQAPISQFALFPDGAYLVDVTATSQGTAFLSPMNQNSDSRYLPSSNVENPNSDPDPVNVDNYRPYVDSLIVYKTTTTSFPPLAAIYQAGWTENVEDGIAEPEECVRGYLPIDDTSADLWIAVRYSEPMDTGSNDVWITGEMKGLNTWTSGTFAPVDILANWPERFGILNSNRLSDGIWYLYKYNGSMPSEYKGRLTIHIDTQDYSGNAVDGDPSTLCSPRSSDGSWPDPQNYENGPDDSYTWGDCSWGSVVDYENETGYYAAHVGETEVQRIDFSEMGFVFGDYINSFHVLGYIPYNCGMYACMVNGYFNPDQIYISVDKYLRVVDGNGNTVGSIVRGPDHGSNKYYEEYSWLKPSSGMDTEWENRYLWFRERYAWGIQWFISDEVWYVIDGHSGNSNIVSAYSTFGPPKSQGWYDGQQYYYVNCNNPEASYSGSTWTTEVYYVTYGEQVPYFKGMLTIFAPTDDLCTGSTGEESESIEHSTPDFAFNLGSVLPNPVTSSASISFSLAVSGTYNISIYDVSGRMISNLSDGNMNSGIHSVTWDVSNNSGNVVPNGIYFVKLEGCGESAVQSLVVLK